MNCSKKSQELISLIHSQYQSILSCYKDAIEAEIDNLSLSRGTGPLVPKHELKLNIRALTAEVLRELRKINNEQ